jgi:hypothetical protein
MKQLVYIDNDNRNDHMFSVGFNHTHHTLIRAGFDRDTVSNMKVVDNFSSLSQKEQTDILFNPQNIIVSYSSYTANHENSYGQLREFLCMVGRNEITGLTYINTSSYLEEAAIRLFREEKGVYDIMQAFAINTIIDADDHAKLAHLTIELKGRYKSPFKRAPLDIEAIMADSEVQPRSRERIRS